MVELDQLRRGPRRPRSPAPSGARLNQRAAGVPGPRLSAAWKAGNARPDVVEHAVEDQPQAALAGGGHQRVEVALVAEPGVDPEVVDGVVAVGLRGEDRAEQQPVAAELDRVVKPRLPGAAAGAWPARARAAPPAPRR